MEPHFIALSVICLILVAVLVWCEVKVQRCAAVLDAALCALQSYQGVFVELESRIEFLRRLNKVQREALGVCCDVLLDQQQQLRDASARISWLEHERRVIERSRQPLLPAGSSL